MYGFIMCIVSMNIPMCIREKHFYNLKVILIIEQRIDLMH